MSTDSGLFVRKSSGLTRNVSANDAFIANLVGMGILVNAFWIVYASASYPNADLTATVFTALVVNLVVAYVYWMLATAMPRTGGDYVWVGRIIHPSIAFMENIVFVVIMITWAGLFPYLAISTKLPMLFTNLAITTGNQSYAGIATALSDPNTIFILSAVIVTFVVLSMFLPVKQIFRLLIAIFGVQAIIFVIFIGMMMSSNHAAFVAGFNAKSGTTIDTIVNSGTSLIGSPITFTSDATAVGLVYTMLSFIGYANSSYFAGEVRGDPRKSQGLAIFVSPIIFGVLIYILYALMYNVFGHDFLVASATLFVNGKSPLPVIPSPAYLVSYITDNPTLAFLVPFGLFLNDIGFAIIYFFVPTRNIFAYSFDRVIPAKFAAVNRRGVPYYAVILYAIIAYFSVYVTVYQTWFSYLYYANFGWWIAVAVVMVAAAIFPFRRKDIFESSPKIVTFKIGPVPLLSIVAVIGIGLSVFISYSTILPSFNGFPINPLYVVSMLFVMVAGLIIYVISYFYQKHRDIPVELASKELPPV
ncbi:MAG TPA: amino acid permease [Terriglobales bacterium]|nr:amino acid permease [Terriglobales bacterium]